MPGTLAAIPKQGLEEISAFHEPALWGTSSTPILALDEIGVELQNPFSTLRLNHLPLDRICENLEQNLMSLLDDVDRSRPIENEDPAAAAAAGHEAGSPHDVGNVHQAGPRDGQAVP